jgi:uncharacterized protein YggL (DUF469 family)
MNRSERKKLSKMLQEVEFCVRGITDKNIDKERVKVRFDELIEELKRLFSEQYLLKNKDRNR